MKTLTFTFRLGKAICTNKFHIFNKKLRVRLTIDNSIQLDFATLQCYERYAILTVNEGKHVSFDEIRSLRQLLKEHFGNREFVLISDRTKSHNVDLNIYKSERIRKMKGLAIVSGLTSQKESAIKEQGLFNRSFAFFTTLDDARSWAEDFFYD